MIRDLVFRGNGNDCFSSLLEAYLSDHEKAQVVPTANIYQSLLVEYSALPEWHIFEFNCNNKANLMYDTGNWNIHKLLK